ncbi:hypothetical protein [Halomonas sp. Mc5H-6]|uniref:hypothetical protein n=1 Tax=Halomonas sp. Mc5H-6 TaxID=2954500 RepID=UPI002097383F|nr:hypothetical protein [Halomonas sp. Mc5H-6]MCO7245255.1 hypothetical protein [Halomonas sp. Mc5H-6]
MNKQPGRPKGVRNLKPSQETVRSYYRLLQAKADQGDANAAGWLLQLDLTDQQKKETAQ